MRRPRETTLPSARTRPVSGVTGRTSEILNSSVVCPEPLVQRRVDREPHAGVEQRRGQTAVHGAGRIAMRRGRLGRDRHVAAGDFDDVIAERLRHAVQRQRAGDETLNELQAAHRPLLVDANDAVAFSLGARGHSDAPSDAQRCCAA
jgi:hypothetical protein